MKLKKCMTLLLTVALCAALLSGCRKKEASPSSSSAESHGTAVSGQISSAPVSGTVSEQQASSLPPSTSQPPESGSVGQVIPVETDDKAFDKLFAKNPVDKAYIKDNDKAYSNVDMIEVSDKYAKVWQQEIEHAYAALLDTAPNAEKTKLKQEQTDWKNGSDKALAKIDADAQTIGGSMAEVDSASRRMEYYRSRAAAVYKELYQYKKDFSYNFK